MIEVIPSHLQLRHVETALFFKSLLGHSRPHITDCYNPKHPEIITDVAHNEESFLVLCGFINKQNINGKKVLMIGLQQNKDLGTATSCIIKTFDQIIITQTGERNFLPAEKLDKLLNYENSRIILNPLKAAKFIRNLDKEDCGVIAGSHYFGPTISNEFKISFDNI